MILSKLKKYIGNSYLAKQDLSNEFNFQVIVTFNTNDILGNIRRLNLIDKNDLVIIF